jgi:hypothetical protein
MSAPKRKFKCPKCETITETEEENLNVLLCHCGTKGSEWVLLSTEFTDEQWEQEIKDLRRIYEGIKDVLQKYIDTTEYNYHIITLWIIGTYVYEEFNTFPLLFINATKGSGKSRLLNLIEALCKNGKIQANLSEAVLFRVKKDHTLLLDEFEQVGAKEKGTLRELINSSYKKGSRVERLKEVKKDGKKDYEIATFDLYSPIAMANIWGMDQTVEDRCIVVRLDKSSNPLITKLQEDFHTNEEISRLKVLSVAKICSLCSVVSFSEPITTWNNYIVSKYMYNNNTTQTTYTTLTTQTTLSEDTKILFEKIDNLGILGRDLELFFPLIIISNALGKDILKATLELAKKHFEEKNLEEFTENPDITMLDFLWRTYSDNPLDYIPIREINGKYSMESEYAKDLEPKTTGRMLQRLNIILDKKRDMKGIKVMLDFGKIKKKLGRYKEVIDK